jgi:hypothetical protein
MFEIPVLGELNGDFETVRLALAFSHPNKVYEALDRIEAWVHELEERNYAAWEASLGEDL